jgi:hypothetical protein
VNKKPGIIKKTYNIEDLVGKRITVRKFAPFTEVIGVLRKRKEILFPDEEIATLYYIENTFDRRGISFYEDLILLVTRQRSLAPLTGYLVIFDSTLGPFGKGVVNEKNGN